MLIWADGFGTYGSSGTVPFFRAVFHTTNSGDEPLQIGSGGGARTGNYFWNTSQIGYNNWRGGRMVGGARSTLGVGAAFYFGSISNDFCPIMFAGDNKDEFQVCIVLNSNGSLSAVLGVSGTVLGTTAGGKIIANNYTYIEAKVFCDDTNGTVEIRINNVVELLVTGVDTKNLGHNRITGIMAGARANFGGTSPLSRVADMVIWDDSGTVNNDFFDDIRCVTVLPTGDGAEQDWSRSTGSSSYPLVDNVPYDTAEYVASGTPGDKVNFTKDALDASTSYVAGIQVFMTALKSDSGACEITPQVVSGASTGAGTAAVLGTGAAVFTSIIETDPATGAHFSKSAFDAALMQVERTA